jgi:hypothetical protein
MRGGPVTEREHGIENQMQLLEQSLELASTILYLLSLQLGSLKFYKHPAHIQKELI